MIEPMDDQVGGQSAASSAELQAAVAKFNEAFAERSFSQRHEDLGKMINCQLCGSRHREGDPVVRLSRAHGEQKLHDFPSRHAPGNRPRNAKIRFNPHRHPKVIQFIQLSEKIYNEDIAPYFRPDPEHPDNLIRRAQRQAARIMRRIWIAQRVARKNMQDHSRRINAGLEIPGSRYSHPVKDRKGT